MPGSLEPILQRIDGIRASIDAASGGRPVRLIAAAKGIPPETVQLAVDAGVVEIGQNYVRELRAVAATVPGVRWHFIGTLQSGTAHHVAAIADVVQTVTGGHATRRLAARASRIGRVLDVLIEVDLTEARTGVPPERLAVVADEIASEPALRLVGLMTLPPIPRTAEDSRPYFVRLRELCEGLRDRHPGLRELSMGMSLDYQVAVQEGATMVRIGTALFGPRP